MARKSPTADIRIGADAIRRRKRDVPIVCLTAYTYPIARLLDEHVDLLLVGDSVAMVLHGHKTTLGASLEMMIAHGQAVMRGSARACVVVDMPAGSYEDSAAQAVASARRIVGETGCQAVKLEGGVGMARQIAAVVDAGIAVMGHIGLLPQSVEKDGGYRIKGRTDENAAALFADARAVEEAGAFSMVIEGTVEAVAAEITRRIAIPTIGIGASGVCDGQILVIDDMVGLTVDRVPKFVKEYADLRSVVSQAAARYASEVRDRTFPGSENVFSATLGKDNR
ncbi:MULTISPECIES: 3-methyl-2-oxobutanoate hydroxymethyltransferase [unclassified Mesorhizobium]|uniref:3-methyl-2-oxobutanoate hydroxymethyltransferase n=1 Tax=unclassified Mesorhizobium TaxID=325217 RepID=UPI001126EEC7|nr:MULTISPECIES: 3-methyl-2-oxobutanoate hydroxymethyltransferase [unclassified Mesorhizobium]TPJ45740.1 3-methyl-2-oxobutanoate hydroxymethyltransferase [Mesorhizobium sp. B2-6-6]MBZ9998592.1 3-methyl-2-oxobutanoate hydroxymethyltransferase [Mesorhizobium sp. B264B2A]MCA0005137.1 3-methyl-2-oxobutanoate hydroxymethyltransferase [Mesorhizobium sp. B264B1B]MCA0019683.1 3-methyl-2-oxobutanoate hydroxymethyltransferase [Mesorhizobium sp. B264B1A]TPJ58427.1 3-methyl-2-oxobutanoate hydroxymethyltra